MTAYRQCASEVIWRVAINARGPVTVNFESGGTFS